MGNRQRLLDVTRRLTVDAGSVPSLNVLASVASVSKGGLTHHFPTRSALVEALIREVISDIDRAMAAAADVGSAASPGWHWHRPDPVSNELFRALAAAFVSLDTDQADHDDPLGALTVAAEAMARWEALIAEEVGDPLLARVIRLIGDGITLNALIGTLSSPREPPPGPSTA